MERSCRVYNKSDTRVLSYIGDEHIGKVLEGNYAFIVDKTFFDMTMIDNCELAMPLAEVLQLQYAMALPNNSPFTKIFTDEQFIQMATPPVMDVGHLLTYTGILHFFQVYALPLPLTTEKSYERIVLTNASNDNRKTVLEEQPYDCHLILSTQDTIDAKQTFQQELLTDDNVFAFYIYLSNPKNITKASLGEYIANDEDGNKWNGLQEWFWVKKSMRYYTLNLPIDLDALTFQISKYGTKNIDIGWTLSTNCQKDNKIEYKNETELILNYIWTNVIGNQTDSYICHRNFENDIGYLELIWKITSIWVGYDFDCYEVNSLKEGIMENELISKNDLTKVLAFAVCFLGFMHPFIWYIFESIQVRKECDIFTYYKDVIDSEKPYGLVRCMRKCLYPGKRKTETETSIQAIADPTTCYTAITSDTTENNLVTTSIQSTYDPTTSHTAPKNTPIQAADDPTTSHTAPTSDKTTNGKSLDMTEISKKNEIAEKEFNYILDRCYSVQKRLFFLVVKTVLTIVFLSVTFLILRETGKFDNSKYLNDFVSYLMILISPKIVSIFSQSSPEEDVQKHENEIPKLIKKYEKRSKVQDNNEYTGDYCWQTFKYPCKCFEHDSWTCSSKCCQVLKAVFCQFYLSTDHSEILSLDNRITKFEASSTCCTCCKRNENNVNGPVITNNTDTGDSIQHTDYGSIPI
ncbi:Hypothetical predicted protein [Mytilus galloprovincialis]|uniref:Uncharacterized protein n=1 Tax=Mytilus galloprovincialis TaxID=29158 RepID=A0A8B6HMN9_MYTGA|nr:Hypothetical predicted protein [Mytilus galloprovincialis]